jgi:hypothetical protein
MKKIIFLFLFFYTELYSQRQFINADSYTIKPRLNNSKSDFITDNIFAQNRFYLGPTLATQTEPFHISTNVRFDGKISLNGNVGLNRQFLISGGNSANASWSLIDWNDIQNKPTSVNSWLKVAVAGESLLGFGNSNTDKFIFAANGQKIAEMNQYGHLYGWNKIGVNTGYYFGATSNDFAYQFLNNYNLAVGGKAMVGYHTNMPTAQKTGTYFFDVAKQQSSDVSKIRFVQFNGSGGGNVPNWSIENGINNTFSVMKLNTNGSADTTNSFYVNAGRFNFGRANGLNNSKFTFGGSMTVTGAVNLGNYGNGFLKSDASGNVTTDNSTYLTTSSASSTYIPKDTLPSTWSGSLTTNFALLGLNKVTTIGPAPNFTPNTSYNFGYYDFNSSALMQALNINNINNTSDVNKPVSTATQTALNLKSDLLNPNFTGSVGIGSSSLTGIGLRVGKNITGATTGIGIYQTGVVQNDVTGTAYGVRNNINTAALSFTLPNYYHFTANQQSIGAGSTVTTQAGFVADATLIGANTNIGFRGLIPFGSSRFNLYLDGTADNFVAGNLYIGTNVGVNSLFVGKSITGGVDAAGIRSSGTIQTDVTNSAFLFRGVLNQAASMTTTSVYGSDMVNGTISGTITGLTSYRAGLSGGVNNTGFSVTNIAGSSTTKGFESQINSGTSKWNAYFSGTAQNYFEGNVGVGLTTAQTKLHVYSTDANMLRLERSGVGISNITVSAQMSNSVSDLLLDAGTNSGGFLFRTKNSSGTSVNSLGIDRDGNIGINTVAPSSRLEVIDANGVTFRHSQTANTAGSTRIWGGAYSGNKMTGLLMATSSGSNTLTLGGGTALSEPVNVIAFNTASGVGTLGAGTEQMRISPSGELLVGTTTGGFKLNVAGTAKVSGALTFSNYTAGFLKTDASGNVTADNSTYLTTSSAASTYAPLASPNFTGVPTAPTAVAGTKSTQLATTEFVNNNFFNKDTLPGSYPLSGNMGIVTLKKVTTTGPPPLFLGTTRYYFGYSDYTDSDMMQALNINNINNTSDLNKPISTATQTALDLKANLTNATFSGTVKAQQFEISSLNTAPSSSTATCTTGQIRITATYIYLCSATNTWVRSAFATF